MVVMKRDVPGSYWVSLPLTTTPNVWLLLYLAEVLQPLQTSTARLDRPWLSPNRTVGGHGGASPTATN
jgi:hypothetical protein